MAHYVPELGRFGQPDDLIPDLGNPQSWNRYAYCVNNPLRYTDPSGHGPQEDFDKMAAGRMAGHPGRVYANEVNGAIPSSVRQAYNITVSTDPNRVLLPAGAYGYEQVYNGSLLNGVPADQRHQAAYQIMSEGLGGAGFIAAPEVPIFSGKSVGVSETLRAGPGNGMGPGAASRAEFSNRLTVGEMSATDRRAHFIKNGVPENQLGPSGYPKVHTVEKSTRKEVVDAARQAGDTRPVKHTQDSGQATHYHPTDRAGNKLTGKDNIHFQQKGAK